MPQPLRVLILEDQETDAELMLRELRKGGFDPEWRRVDTETDFLDELARPFDLILADNSLPQYGAIQALVRVRELALDIPVIIVSGSIGEEMAVSLIRHGASDYLMKDRLGRLGQAVMHALEQKRLRDENRAAQKALQALNEELERRIIERTYELEAANQALTRSQERLVLAQRAGQIGTFEWNIQTNAVNWSAEEELMYGLQPGGFDGKYKDWAEAVHLEDRAEAEREVRRAVEERRELNIEFRIVWPDGQVRWIAAKGSVFYDEQGTPLRMVGVNIDITDRKQAELERARLLQDAIRREQELRDKQQQLLQAAKLASIGELATGVAHELNNPLNNIGLFVGNVIDHLARGQVAQDVLVASLEGAQKQVRKAATIITHLRTFSRMASVEHEPVSINSVISSALSLMQEHLRLHNIQVTLDLTESDPSVLGSSIHLEQVMINLLTNARDAVKDAARKEIVVASALSHRGVELTVADTGSGILPHALPRVFDPFFTTKPVGEGTGLGLSIAYGIIQEHRGIISVDSRPDEGATFRIQLPVAETPS